MTETTALQEQLTDKSAKLSQLTMKHVEPPDKLYSFNFQNATVYTVPKVLNSVKEACKCPAKRAKVTRQCKCSFATPSTAPFSLFPAKHDDF